MGYAYTHLIPLAILMDNPGINREEFISLLDRVHCSSYYDYYAHESLTALPSVDEDREYHSGLEGLARILNLETSKDFNDYTKNTIDENGLRVMSPYYMSANTDWREKDDGVRLVVHEKNIPRERNKTVRNIIVESKYRVGDISDRVIPDRVCVVRRVLSSKKISASNGFGDPALYRCSFVVDAYEPVISERIFGSKQELWKEHPQFHPQNVFDWNQRNGHFHGFLDDKKTLLWKNDEGKYSVDEETWKNIPAQGIVPIISGYTDVMVTRAAYRRSAWKVLSRRGLRHLSEFFSAFPDAKREYEEAIRNSHFSEHAQNKGMSTAEMLRLRIDKNGMDFS